MHNQSLNFDLFKLVFMQKWAFGAYVYVMGTLQIKIGNIEKFSK